MNIEIYSSFHIYFGYLHEKNKQNKRENKNKNKNRYLGSRRELRFRFHAANEEVENRGLGGR